MIGVFSKALLLLASLCASARPGLAQQREGLSSALQQVRDIAAETTRATFVPTPRAKWEPLLHAIKSGDPREDVVNLLPEPASTPIMVLISGRGSRISNETFRLDDEWFLRCVFGESLAGPVVIEATLVEWMQEIGVAPPSSFTGLWRTYFVNGQVSHEIEYVDGKYSGALTAFFSDGSKAYVHHYRAGEIHGDNIGYFPSGHISYRGRYEKATKVGTWIHYNEDGTVRATEQYPDPGS